jgi:hypothetical protein
MAKSTVVPFELMQQKQSQFKGAKIRSEIPKSNPKLTRGTGYYRRMRPSSVFDERNVVAPPSGSTISSALAGFGWCLGGVAI